MRILLDSNIESRAFDRIVTFMTPYFVYGAACPLAVDSCMRIVDLRCLSALKITKNFQTVIETHKRHRRIDCVSSQYQKLA